MFCCVFQGAIGALRKVCEDAGHEILTQNVDLLRFMFPKWIEFLRHENSQMRMQALTCLNLFVLWADVLTGPNELLSCLFK